MDVPDVLPEGFQCNILWKAIYASESAQDLYVPGGIRPFLERQSDMESNSIVPGIPFEEVCCRFLLKLPQYEKRIAENGLPEKKAGREDTGDGDERRQ